MSYLVSRPKVIFKEIDGVKCEPMEMISSKCAR